MVVDVATTGPIEPVVRAKSPTVSKQRFSTTFRRQQESQISFFLLNDGARYEAHQKRHSAMVRS